MSREEARVLDMIRRLEEKGKELEERQRRRGERMAWRRQVFASLVTTKARAQ